MKNIIYKVIVSLVAIFGLLACNDDEVNFLSEEDQIAVEGMQTSYENAADHYSAYRISFEENDSIGVHMHDSLFHHHVDLFDEHHTNYSHDSYHDDHHHDAHGMHMSNNGISGHHNWQDGHHSQDHDQMDELTEDHDANNHHDLEDDHHNQDHEHDPMN
jgi:hypothetical protein